MWIRGVGGMGAWVTGAHVLHGHNELEVDDLIWKAETQRQK